jgi:hypothetical protein
MGASSYQLGVRAPVAVKLVMLGPSTGAWFVMLARPWATFWPSRGLPGRRRRG